MSRMFCGLFAILCAAAVGTALNATRFPVAKAPWSTHVEFFMATVICFAAGALVFEIGKLFAPTEQRQ